jgi:Cu+-exporting ATPase
MLAAATDFDSPTGKGVICDIDVKTVLTDNATFLAEAGVDTKSVVDEANRLRRDGATAVDLSVAGVFAVSDPVKPTTPKAIASLQPACTSPPESSIRYSASCCLPSLPQRQCRSLR